MHGKHQRLLPHAQGQAGLLARQHLVRLALEHDAHVVLVGSQAQVVGLAAPGTMLAGDERPAGVALGLEASPWIPLGKVSTTSSSAGGSGCSSAKTLRSRVPGRRSVGMPALMAGARRGWW